MTCTRTFWIGKCLFPTNVWCLRFGNPKYQLTKRVYSSSQSNRSPDIIFDGRKDEKGLVGGRNTVAGRSFPALLGIALNRASFPNPDNPNPNIYSNKFLGLIDWTFNETMAPTLSSALTLSTLGLASKAFLRLGCRDFKMEGLEVLMNALKEDKGGSWKGKGKEEPRRRRGIVTSES